MSFCGCGLFSFNYDIVDAFLTCRGFSLEPSVDHPFIPFHLDGFLYFLSDNLECCFDNKHIDMYSTVQYIHTHFVCYFFVCSLTIGG